MENNYKDTIKIYRKLRDLKGSHWEAPMSTILLQHILEELAALPLDVSDPDKYHTLLFCYFEHIYFW